MKSIKEVLEIIDELLCRGYDNSTMYIISDDLNVNLNYHFGVKGADGRKSVKRGIYLYEIDESDSIFEKVDAIYINRYNGKIGFISI